MWHDMMGFMSGNGWEHMFFGGIIMLIFWGLIIALIVAAVRHFAKARAQPAPPDAQAILRERYARGEIDRQEFEARKRDLSS